MAGYRSRQARSRAHFVAKGGVTPTIPALALTFSDGTPLQFSDGSYLELAA